MNLQTSAGAIPRVARRLAVWMLNRPTPDWEAQLDLLVEHTRCYGLVIHPVSIQSLHDLVEARVNGTGPFAAHGPYRWGQPTSATETPIQLAVAVGVDDGTRTDAEPAMNQGMQISRRLSGRDASMDRLVFGMQAAEVAGNAAGVFVGSGVIIRAGIKGGTWAVVKSIAVAGAAIAAEQGAERALRAAGAGEQTIRGVRLAAVVVTLILFRRKSGSDAAKPSPGSGPEPPTSPKTTTPGGPKAPQGDVRSGPFANPSGNLDDAARAARTQPHGPARVPRTARASIPRAKTYPPIEGTVDTPRTPEHKFLQRTVAEEMRDTGDYQRIGMNMNLSKFTGQPHSPDIKPDNIGLTAEGKIDMIEILSPGQKRAILEDKLEKAMNQLPPEMRGEFSVTDPKDAFK